MRRVFRTAEFPAICITTAVNVIDAEKVNQYGVNFAQPYGTGSGALQPALGGNFDEPTCSSSFRNRRTFHFVVVDFR